MYPKKLQYLNTDVPDYQATHGLIVVPDGGGEPLFVSNADDVGSARDGAEKYAAEFPDFEGVVSVVIFLPNIKTCRTDRFEIKRRDVEITKIN